MRIVNAQKGYTLLEVLVAMTILAMTLTVLFRVFSSGLYNVRVAADYTRAVSIAESLLLTPADDDRSNAGQGSVNEFDWTRRTRQLTDAEIPDIGDIDVRAVEVAVQVEWQRAGKTRALTLSTVILVKGEVS